MPHAPPAASPAPPAAASGGWPRIAGINGREARARLGGDTNLLRALLRRMFSEFGDACEGRGDLLRHDPSLATQRLHKLRGIAGNLGAEHIAHLAGELETALRAGQDDDLEANGARLCEALRTLREAAAGFIGVTAEADSGESAPLDPVRLTQLYSALADNDLAALDLFSALAGALRSALGSERTARLQAAVEDLRFGDALRELEPFGSAQTPPDEGREGGSL